MLHCTYSCHIKGFHGDQLVLMKLYYIIFFWDRSSFSCSTLKHVI